MKNCKFVVLALLLSLVFGSSLWATVITFDDLSSYDAIPNGYYGFEWTNAWVLEGSRYPNSGYDKGTVSNPNVMYNGWDRVVTIDRDTPFTFLGAYVTAAWDLSTDIQFDVYHTGSTTPETHTYTIGMFTPTHLDVVWEDIDRMVIDTPSGYQFVIDNFEFEAGGAPPAPVPEPTTALLMGLGLCGLAGFMRYKTRS